MRFLLRLLIVLALALPMAVQAQPAPERNLGPHELLDRWDAESDDIERQLDLEDADHTDYERLRTELEQQASRVPALLDGAEAAAVPIRQQLDALGPPPEEGETEAESVATERARLKGELQKAEALIARLNQSKARAETLIQRTIVLRRALFTDRLMTRGPVPVLPATVANGFKALARFAGVVMGETRYRLQQLEIDLSTTLRFLGALAVLVAVLVGLRLLRRLVVRKLSNKVGPDSTRARRVSVGCVLTLVRVVMPTAAIFVALIGVAMSDLLGPEGMKLLYISGIAGSIFVAAWALSLSYFAPSHHRLRLSSLDDEAAGRAHWWMVSLAGLVALDMAFVRGGHQLGIAIEALTLVNAILLVLGGIAVWRLIAKIARRQPDVPTGIPDTDAEEEPVAEVRREVGMISALAALARLLGRIGAVAAPVLALAGYFAASRYAFYPLVFSGAVIAFCLLLYQIAQAAVEWLLSGKEETESERLAKGRLRLIPVAVGFLLTCAALPLVALIWGASVNDLGLIWRRLVEGIELGDLRLSPTIVFKFFVVFAIGYLITKLIQSILGRSVLPLTGLDTGGRDAIRAGVGYLGVTLAVVAAVASAGIDLSNLAIALGALSVGIGFGLQNVVNNFVSGIILLIERPIKTGDWVELTSGMGYVKQINVRSTEIETFDRSALIVPNSELISAPVVNWTHSNNNGRMIVKVHVAYGTDPRAVEKILLEIVKAHPMLLRRPAPFVLFNNFGPNALEFEIRGILRDVNWVLNVASDIRYEISERFAEEGIEIPLSQHDLHLKNAGELGEALGRSLGSGARIARARPPVDKTAEPEPVEPFGDHDGGEGLLRLDKSGRRDPVTRGEIRRDREAPWQALTDAQDATSDDAGKPGRPRFGRAAGMDGGDGDGSGDGR